jgi:exodeoxyribonuclease (lambda-induced)
MQIHNCIQGGELWLNLRAGRFTATDAPELMPDKRTGKAKKGLDTLAYKKAAYWLTGNLPDTPTTAAMEWGKMQEPHARALYAEITGNEVQEVGFVELDDYVGCSPDGLVGEEGLIEIKCKQDYNHLYAVCNEWVEPEHELQMQYQMLVTERHWCDYVLYNPLFKNPIYVKRIFKDVKVQAQLADGLANGRELIKQIIKNYDGRYL